MSAIELAQSLIKIKSISPKDEGCFDLVEAELAPLGFETKHISAPRKPDSGMPLTKQ